MSDLVGNPKDQFSLIAAHLETSETLPPLSLDFTDYTGGPTSLFSIVNLFWPESRTSNISYLYLLTVQYQYNVPHYSVVFNITRQCHM